MALLETIPNVSEGRRVDVLERLAGAVASVGPQVALLDRTADPSHHRAVFTIAGTADGLERAVLALAEVAVACIDMRTHTGVHPRIGALDVVPFVPLGETTMAEAIELAHRVAARIARDFRIPAFLYEAAATRPDRHRLEIVRRGGFERLPARMAAAGGHPDFGPTMPHPTAGAVVVGARDALIAWNLNLATDDLTIACEIAREVRASSGGLPHVKAMGVRLAHRGLVQVSMNVTDYRITPMSLVFARVADGAARRGTSIADSEIIGLLPRDALAETAEQVPWLASCHAHQTLENRLAAHKLTPDRPADEAEG